MVRAILKGQALIDFSEFVLRGYTVRRIRELMLERKHNLSQIPDTPLIKLMREVGVDVRDARTQLDKDTPDVYGLAGKMERIRRLIEAAELIEKNVPTSTKWSAEYRRYLAQIQAELEPLGLTIHAADSWAQLLERLAGMANVEERDPPTES